MDGLTAGVPDNGRSPPMEPLAPDSYAQFLADLKRRIQAAQLRASVAVNRELVLLYWQIGRDILERQQRETWGAKVIGPAGGRPEARVSRHERLFGPQSQVYAPLCRGLE